MYVLPRRSLDTITIINHYQHSLPRLIIKCPSQFGTYFRKRSLILILLSPLKASKIVVVVVDKGKESPLVTRHSPLITGFWVFPLFQVHHQPRAHHCVLSDCLRTCKGCSTIVLSNAHNMTAQIFILNAAGPHIRHSDSTDVNLQVVVQSTVLLIHGRRFIQILSRLQLLAQWRTFYL
jgi:hypothetical protein